MKRRETDGQTTTERDDRKRERQKYNKQTTTGRQTDRQTDRKKRWKSDSRTEGDGTGRMMREWLLID